MLPSIPTGWSSWLEPETRKPYYRDLTTFLDQEASQPSATLPQREDIFNALRLTPLKSVRVLLLGQDPYPTPGHAHGLCFSVRPEVRPIPRSLQNIYKELQADIGFRIPNHGCLESWASQGVLLLNTVLTVRAGEANSHKDRGWETFTSKILEGVNSLDSRVVFLLWGRQAQKKREAITNPLHAVIECAHPSPLSARHFFGCRCFSKTNHLLRERGLPPVEWGLADRPLPHSHELNLGV
jgi:uracil-DNA glycosylase